MFLVCKNHHPDSGVPARRGQCDGQRRNYEEAAAVGAATTLKCFNFKEIITEFCQCEMDYEVRNYMFRIVIFPPIL
jgi:hypothetical protein